MGNPVPSKLMRRYFFFFQRLAFKLIEVADDALPTPDEWPRFFNGIEAVVFVASLTEYDQSFDTEKGLRFMANCMRDSLSLFSRVCR